MSKEIINSFKEYQEKYTLLLGNFCNNKDFDEIDFITTEIDYYRIYLTSVGMYKRIRYRGVGDPHLEDDLRFLSGNNASYDLVVDLIMNKTRSEGIDNLDSIIADYKIHFNKIISFLETKKLSIETPSTESDSFKEVDLSGSNLVQKIIYLNELGIIDLLRKEPCFATSVNNLANVITAITGAKHISIQPYLNALLSNTEAENKNPYNSKASVNKVKKHLIDLGVQSK